MQDATYWIPIRFPVILGRLEKVKMTIFRVGKI